MDYKFWFFMGIAFVLGRFSKLQIYIGNDRAKYEKADLGLLIR